MLPQETGSAERAHVSAGSSHELPTVGFREPSLECIIEGSKTFEARLAADSDTKHLRVGSCFRGCSRKQQVAIEVTSMQEYDSFGDAWVVHGKRLVPPQWDKPRDKAAAQALYQKFFQRPLTARDRVRIFGVRLAHD